VFKLQDEVNSVKNAIKNVWQYCDFYWLGVGEFVIDYAQNKHYKLFTYSCVRML